jgi:hypothetical protein
MTQKFLAREGETMAISLPPPEEAPGRRLDHEAQRATSPTFRGGRILERFYERVRSAIFDPDGDCVRFR